MLAQEDDGVSALSLGGLRPFGVPPPARKLRDPCQRLMETVPR